MSLPSAPVRMPAPRRRWVHGVGLAAAVLVAVIPLWYTLAGREAQSIHYATVAGEQRTITLADGSRVTLNTRTGLEALIGRDRREVVLESGEAFFEVAHDPMRPFRVLTSLGIVSVLGTRFTVYDRLRSVEVTTEKGLVRVSSAGLPESIAAIHVRSGESAVITAPDARPRLQKAEHPSNASKTGGISGLNSMPCRSPTSSKNSVAIPRCPCRPRTRRPEPYACLEYSVSGTSLRFQRHCMQRLASSFAVRTPDARSSSDLKTARQIECRSVPSLRGRQRRGRDAPTGRRSAFSSSCCISVPSAWESSSGRRSRARGARSMAYALADDPTELHVISVCQWAMRAAGCPGSTAERCP